jgi:hypothetical protein
MICTFCEKDKKTAEGIFRHSGNTKNAKTHFDRYHKHENKAMQDGKPDSSIIQDCFADIKRFVLLG